MKSWSVTKSLYLNITKFLQLNTKNPAIQLKIKDIIKKHFTKEDT